MARTTATYSGPVLEAKSCRRRQYVEFLTFLTPTPPTPRILHPLGSSAISTTPSALLANTHPPENGPPKHLILPVPEDRPDTPPRPGRVRRVRIRRRRRAPPNLPK